MGGLGTQYGSLGQATQQLGAADTGLLAGLGGLERQVAQSQLDAMRQTQVQEAFSKAWVCFGHIPRRAHHSNGVDG
mgnify:CR=1 FL=1